MGNSERITTTIIAMVLLVGGGFWGWQKIGKNIAHPNNVSITSLQEVEKRLELETTQVQKKAENAKQENFASKNPENKNVEEAEKVDTKEAENFPQSKETRIEAEEKSDGSNALSGKIVQKLISWGYAASKSRKIDTIIVHSSYDALGSKPYDTEGLIKEYKQYGVAAHYLIDREGVIYQLIADNNVAYHAGESKVPDGRTNVNNFSLGIELMNTEKDAYTSVQYSALNGLIAKLKKSYKIKYVLGHKDIAPGRKTDPWGMDWSKVEK